MIFTEKLYRFDVYDDLRGSTLLQERLNPELARRHDQVAPYAYLRFWLCLRGICNMRGEIK